MMTMRRPGTSTWSAVEPKAPSGRYVHLDSPGWALWELVVAGFSVSFAMGCATLFYLLQ